MKYVKVTGLVALAVAFIALIVALIWHANHRNVEKEESNLNWLSWQPCAARTEN